MIYLPEQVVKERFKLKRRLGKGGLGEVWLAKDMEKSLTVALKIDKSSGGVSSSSNYELLEILSRIIILSRLKGLNSSSIVKIFDIFFDNDTIIYSMEYLDGRTLQEEMLLKSYNVDEAIQLIIKISECVKCLHQQGIIYRDIKPSNLMIVNNSIKLFDFNTAILEYSINNKFSMARTPEYSAPEQIVQNAKISFRTDIYSLGILFYELLTNNFPFHSDDEKKIGVDPISPSFLNPCIPKEIDKITLHCLQRNPKKRYENIGMLIQDLQKIDIQPKQKEIARNLLEDVNEKLTICRNLLTFVSGSNEIQTVEKFVSLSMSFYEKDDFENSISFSAKSKDIAVQFREKASRMVQVLSFKNRYFVIIFFLGLFSFILWRIGISDDINHAILSSRIIFFMISWFLFLVFIISNSYRVRNFLKRSFDNMNRKIVILFFAVLIVILINPLLVRHLFVFKNFNIFLTSNSHLKLILQFIGILFLECLFINLMAIKLSRIIFWRQFPKNYNILLIGGCLVGDIGLTNFLLPIHLSFSIQCVISFLVNVLKILLFEGIFLGIFTGIINLLQFIESKTISNADIK